MKTWNELKEMREEDWKICFKDLSVSLKTIVVLSWVLAGLTLLSFIAGFLQGAMA